MNERSNEERLNDYVDGRLDAVEVEAVERLIELDDEARATVDFLRSLKARTTKLPESIPPRRDLWPAIAARLSPARLVRVDFGGAAQRTDDSSQAAGAAESWMPHLAPRQWGNLAAAALLLIVASSSITALLMSGTPSDGPQGAGTPIGVALEAPRPEAQYAVEIEQLLSALYENRESLDPETVTTIETNLRVIDRAIRRSRAALEDDPENAGLMRVLGNNYRHKLELLQRASRIIERS